MLQSVYRLGAVIERWLRGPGGHRPTRAPQRQEFHSVAIRAPAGACKAARALASARFLAGDAPLLPLEGCTRACKCSFIHYDDRREDLRRTVDIGLPDPIYSGREARAGRGRRRTDREDDDDDDFFDLIGKRQPRGDGDP